MADQEVGNVHGLAIVNKGSAVIADRESASIVIDATGGTWDLRIFDTAVADVDFDVTATNLATAINNALAGADKDDRVTVTGGPGATAPLVVVAVTPGDIEDLTTDATNLTGGAGTAVATITQGTREPFVTYDSVPNMSGTSDPDIGFSDANMLSISALRTRLAAIDGGYYTTARLNQMTRNDMVWAVRQNDHPESISQ